MIRIVLELRDNAESAAFAGRLRRIQGRLDGIAPGGQDWIKITLMDQTVNARLVASE